MKRTLIVGSAGGASGELLEYVRGRCEFHSAREMHLMCYGADPPPVRPSFTRRGHDLLHQCDPPLAVAEGSRLLEINGRGKNDMRKARRFVRIISILDDDQLRFA